MAAIFSRIPLEAGDNTSYQEVYTKINNRIKNEVTSLYSKLNKWKGSLSSLLKKVTAKSVGFALSPSIGGSVGSVLN
jgi:hypothetical protein